MYTLTLGNRRTGSHGVTSYHSYSEAKREFGIALTLRSQACDADDRIVILRENGRTIRTELG